MSALEISTHILDSGTIPAFFQDGTMAQLPSSAPQFFTVAEVAQMTRVSRMTVYRMVHAGELPAVRVGNSYRVPKSAVDQLLAGGLSTDVRQVSGS